MDIKVDEIPSLAVQIVKKKTKHCGWMDEKMDGQHENSIPPHKHSFGGLGEGGGVWYNEYYYTVGMYKHLPGM